MALKIAPALAFDPDLPAAGVVDRVGDPDGEAGVAGRGAMGHGREAEELPLVNEIDPGGGDPFALVVAGGDDAVGPDAHAVGVAQADGKDLDFGAVL